MPATPSVKLERALFLGEGGDGAVPAAVRGGSYHALKADVFVKPDRPVNGVAVVDVELGLQQGEAGGVDAFVVRVKVRGGVNGAEFAVPDRCAVGSHEEGFTDEGGFEPGVFGRGAGVGWAGREAHHL